MRILHVVSSYYPAFEMGGPIESVHSLNKSLARKGVDITVYTTNVGLRNTKRENIKPAYAGGVKVFYFPYYGYIHFTFSPALCWAVRKNIKNFDLVHISGVWNFPVIVAAFWARFYRKPYVISPRGSLMKEPLEKKSSLRKKLFLWLFIKRVFLNASAVHFTCGKEKEEYLAAGLRMRRAIVIPNGVEIQYQEVRPPEINGQYLGGWTSQKLFRKKFGIPNDAKMVLFLSRLNWKKGLDTLIPAFAEVIKKEPKAVLVLAGPDENSYKKEIIKMIDDVNAKTFDVLRTSDVQNIIFTEMLLGEDKIAAYQGADVFVLPSYSENFGMAVVEAMACELPVVITKGVGISSEVEKAGAGIVVEKDTAQVADAVLKVLNNSDLAKKMGESGRKLVETEFSSEKVAERWMVEYSKIIENRSAKIADRIEN